MRQIQSNPSREVEQFKTSQPRQPAVLFSSQATDSNNQRRRSAIDRRRAGYRIRVQTSLGIVEWEQAESMKRPHFGCALNLPKRRTNLTAHADVPGLSGAT